MANSYRYFGAGFPLYV